MSFIKFLAKSLGFLGLGVLILFAALIYWDKNRGFSDDDISAMKRSIKTEFEKKEGISVSDVVMMKETDNKATGFVKLNIKGLGLITKSCNSTMAQNSRDYYWRCD